MNQDTERLDFLMQFFEVSDVGDESLCVGVVVDTDAVGEAFDFGALKDEQWSPFSGWKNPDMRRAIDKAIQFQKQNIYTDGKEKI